MTQVLIAALLFGARVAAQKPQLAQTPPMGWMSWEDFRCEVDCAKNPDACINEALYKSMANRLRDDGYIAAGYRTISIDDCWESGTPGVLRSPGGPLQMNASRFPSGPKALADYIHARGAKFGIYSDEGTETCQGYYGSEGYEALDAKTFASWGVGVRCPDAAYCRVSRRWRQ